MIAVAVIVASGGDVQGTRFYLFSGTLYQINVLAELFRKAYYFTLKKQNK